MDINLKSSPHSFPGRRPTTTDLLATAVLAILFLVNFLPHYYAKMPMHADTWIFISLAEHANRLEALSFPDPFRGEEKDYPKGFVALLSTLSGISSIPLHLLPILLTSSILLAAGAANYSIARGLTGNRNIALLAMMFTTLTLSDIRMMGFFYQVPLAAGALLFLFMLSALQRGRFILSLLFLLAISLTHRSSLLLAAAAISIHLLVMAGRREKRRTLVLAYIPTCLAAAAFLYLFLFKDRLPGAETLKVLFSYDRIEYLKLLTPVFFFFMVLGFFFILLKGKRNRWLPSALLLLLAIDYLICWKTGSGFLIPYRRLSFFLVLLAPPFVAFGLHGFLEYLYRRLASPLKGRSGALKAASAAIAAGLFVYSILINARGHASMILVDEEELGLFRRFGEIRPGEYLMTDHLEAFSLPYFDLRPVITSPHHFGGWLNFENAYFAYADRDVPRLARFFDGHEKYNYLYYRGAFESDRFVEVLRQGDLCIYQYDRETPKEGG